ncbi:MAG: polymerase subunit delta [Pseudomonadota bacterium]|jgi:DNA polymerase-3 subunit delta'
MTQALNAPWIERQVAQLLQQRGHAWLLQGPSGLGHYALALALARAWLCEQASPSGACGQCASCHAIDVHTHADLLMLMPETTMMELSWPLSSQAQDKIDKKERKPSKEIRVDALRDAVEFSQRTDARGRGKVVLVYPAERMNAIAANTLLKTLEEPPGNVRFVLACENAQLLLPTIRSRCQSFTLQWPQADESLQWLQAQGVSPQEAPRLLALMGHRPDDALAESQQGRASSWWSALPKAVAQGQVQHLADLSPSQQIQALMKVAHDAVLVASGAQPRYFSTSELPATPASLRSLSDWYKRLQSSLRTAEHPFNAGLMLEALLSDAQQTLQSAS